MVERPAAAGLPEVIRIINEDDEDDEDEVTFNPSLLIIQTFVIFL